MRGIPVFFVLFVLYVAIPGSGLNLKRPWPGQFKKLKPSVAALAFVALGAGILYGRGIGKRLRRR